MGYGLTNWYNVGMDTRSSTVTAKGQVTVPKHLRDAIGLHPGDTARFEMLDGHTLAITSPRDAQAVRQLVGQPSHTQPLSAKEKARLQSRNLA